MFCEVERSYVEDGFNLYGLRACVSNFSDCLDLILDRIGPDDSDDSHLTQSACKLYGLIHARYIITAHGLDAMYSKVSIQNSHSRCQPHTTDSLNSFHFESTFQYAAKEFGTCPLVQCSGQPVLPVGLKDEVGSDTVKIYCPKCSSVYHLPPGRSRTGNASGVDGAAFGTTFPHLFLMTFTNLVPDPLPVESAYVPRIFGFRVHKSARKPPRNVMVMNPPAAAPATAPAPASTTSRAAGNGVVNLTTSSVPAPTATNSATLQKMKEATENAKTALLAQQQQQQQQRQLIANNQGSLAASVPIVVNHYQHGTGNNATTGTITLSNPAAEQPPSDDGDDKRSRNGAGSKRRKEEKTNGGGNNSPTVLKDGGSAKRRKRPNSST